MPPTNFLGTPFTSNPAMQTIIKAASARKEGEPPTQETIDQLDKALNSIDPSSYLYGRNIALLRRLSRNAGLLPSSCYLHDDIKIDKPQPISQTMYSDIYRGVCREKPVALKSLRVNVENNSKVERKLIDEVVGWKYLRHPNIVPFLGMTLKFPHLPFCIVSEWMAYSSLVVFLEQNSHEDRASLVNDVLTGLSFMHSHEIVHGDLKGANILVDESRHARIGDFGLTVMLLSTHTISQTASMKGTIRWMAPELFGDDAEPTMAADMWAIGMVLYEVYSGLVPYHTTRLDLRIMQAICNGERPERPDGQPSASMSSLMWSIMQDCWTMSPAARPTCSSLMDRLRGDQSTQLQQSSLILGAKKSGIYEIRSKMDQVVLDVNETTNREVVWWIPHAGDNQRWVIKKVDHGYTMQSIVNGLFLAGADHDTKAAHIWTDTEAFVWEVQVVEGAYVVMSPQEKLAITKLPHCVLELQIYNPMNMNQQWVFNQEIEERRPEVLGSIQFVHIPTGRTLEIMSKHEKAGVRCGTSLSAMNSFKLEKTPRGYAIRSIENGGYLHVRGHKPVRKNMSLRTGKRSTSWIIKPVGNPENGVYRISWPGDAFAVGYIPFDQSQSLPQEQTNPEIQPIAQLRMFPTNNDGPHLYWKLVRAPTK